MGAQQLRVRRDVLSLEDSDETLHWYASAVRELKSRELSDPTSWDYLAAVHGRDPIGQKPGFWDQCQHQTWYFLPWHRGYLHWFEDIVQAAITKLGGPSDWALPYWNYLDQHRPDARKVPAAFRDPESPLFADRDPRINAGGEIDPRRLNADALGDPNFISRLGADGFGGPATGFNHGGGQFGDLESMPHGFVHIQVGGLMANPATAARDPIFWLHHANIDRLWEVWIRTLGNANPTDSNWLNLRPPFKLHDAAGKVVTFRSSDMLDTTSPLLSYKYDSLVDPRPAVPEDVRLTKELIAPMRPTDVSPPEMVGATSEGLQLGDEPASTVLGLSEPTGPVRDLLVRMPETPPRIFLNVENVTGTEVATDYDVYLNLPADADLSADPERFEDRFAGVLTTFGIARASSPDDEHGGSGLHATFDITGLVDRQREEGVWDPSSLRVTFSPNIPERRAAPVTVGQVSVTYSE